MDNDSPLCTLAERDPEGYWGPQSAPRLADKGGRRRLQKHRFQAAPYVNDVFWSRREIDFWIPRRPDGASTVKQISCSPKPALGLNFFHGHESPHYLRQCPRAKQRDCNTEGTQLFSKPS